MTPVRPSSLGLFWRSLVEDGRVGIFSADPPEPGDFPGLRSFIAEHDADGRMHLAYSPPPLDSSSAEWACVTLYRACQFLVIRDIEAEIVTGELSRPCPGVQSASAVYSVDLAFRHLGAILNHAARIAEDDPLTTALRTLACEWPLSSVGVEGVEPTKVEVILEDRCLRTLYVDRIIAHRDLSRLGDFRVAGYVAAALGAHPGLAPEISHHLSKVSFNETG